MKLNDIISQAIKEIDNIMERRNRIINLANELGLPTSPEKAQINYYVEVDKVEIKSVGRFELRNEELKRKLAEFLGDVTLLDDCLLYTSPSPRDS